MANRTHTPGVDLEVFLEWYEHFCDHPMDKVVGRNCLNALVPGDKTEQEKLQFIRDEIKAGRKVVY